ncbi:MAG: GIY-YIG nuclease family protein [Cytophagales bacterium]|jgi:putative endonuclease|nr:GIY-YIG nuclease family protein [Cytophagales bacterium]
MYYVYVLRSVDFGRFYVGLSDNVERRLNEHNKGKTSSTRFYAPWELVFVENFETRVQAREREKYLKGGSGKEFIKRYYLGL